MPAYFAFHEAIVQGLGRPAWAFPIDGSSAPVLTSRGCPYRCVHCSSNPTSRTDGRSDESDPEEIAIAQAMRYLYSKGAHPGRNIPAGLTCKEMADELFSKEWVNRDREKCLPDAIADPCRDALLEVVKPGKGKRYPDGRDLGYAFRAWKGRLVEGADIWGQEDARARYAWRIVATEGHGGALRWSVEAGGSEGAWIGGMAKRYWDGMCNFSKRIRFLFRASSSILS